MAVPTRSGLAATSGSGTLRQCVSNDSTVNGPLGLPASLPPPSLPGLVVPASAPLSPFEPHAASAPHAATRSTPMLAVARIHDFMSASLFAQYDSAYATTANAPALTSSFIDRADSP